MKYYYQKGRSFISSDVEMKGQGYKPINKAAFDRVNSHSADHDNLRDQLKRADQESEKKKKALLAAGFTEAQAQLLL